ncbi:hypothetical protein H2204_014472, partial [Knufia peltigerae]
MASTPVLPAWLQPEPHIETKQAGFIKEGMTYEDRLFHYTYSSRHDELYFLEYRLLERMNIFHLQNKLARLKGSCWEKQTAVPLDSDSDDLRITLHQYATAVRDYAFMRSLQDLPVHQASERERDLAQAFPEIAEQGSSPFNSRYCTVSSSIRGGAPSDPCRRIMCKILPRRLTYTKAEMESHFDDFLARKPPSTVSPFVDRLTRFLIAFTGGASLIVPMLVM